jgi:hypothetical protein
LDFPAPMKLCGGLIRRFPTPFVDGIPWSTPWFLAANYAAIFAV